MKNGYLTPNTISLLKELRDLTYETLSAVIDDLESEDDDMIDEDNDEYEKEIIIDDECEDL